MAATSAVDAKQIPPATFQTLVMTLAAQAATMLGQQPNPATGKTEVMPEVAKHLIDTLGMLEEKTKGNLNADEMHLLNGVTHQLRMAYVQATATK